MGAKPEILVPLWQGNPVCLPSHRRALLPRSDLRWKLIQRRPSNTAVERRPRKLSPPRRPSAGRKQPLARAPEAVINRRTSASEGKERRIQGEGRACRKRRRDEAEMQTEKRKPPDLDPNMLEMRPLGPAPFGASWPPACLIPAQIWPVEAVRGSPTVAGEVASGNPTARVEFCDLGQKPCWITSWAGPIYQPQVMMGFKRSIHTLRYEPEPSPMQDRKTQPSPPAWTKMEQKRRAPKKARWAER